MSAKRSDFMLRPTVATFILSLLLLLSLTIGCAVKHHPPDVEVTNIADQDALEAGSMALYMRGLLYESSTNPSPAEADAAYSHALELNPYNKNALSSLVNLRFQQKRFEEAYAALAARLSNFPRSTDLQLYAAQLADHLKKPGEAAFYCEKALANNPTNNIIAQSAVRYHFENSNDKKALKTLNNFAGQLDNPAALKFATDTIVALHKSENENSSRQALKCSDVALKFTSNNKEISDVLMLKGYFQLETAQTNSAVNTLEKSFQLNPDNHIPLAELAKIHASSPEMLRDLENQNREPNSEITATDLILGQTYNFLERPRDAAAKFECYYNKRARQGCFVNKRFYLLLGTTYERYKAYDKIDRLFQDALGAFPDDPDILNFAAYLWSERGINLAQALRHINTALRKEPDNPAYLDTKGWILHKAGRHYQALQLLLKACAIDNREPVILEHTGDVLYEVGNDILALDFWKKSYIITPRQAVADKLTRQGEPLPKTPKNPETN